MTTDEPLPFGVHFPPSLGVEVVGCAYPYRGSCNLVQEISFHIVKFS